MPEPIRIVVRKSDLPPAPISDVLEGLSAHFERQMEEMCQTIAETMKAVIKVQLPSLFR